MRYARCMMLYGGIWVVMGGYVDLLYIIGYARYICYLRYIRLHVLLIASVHPLPPVT